MLRPYVQCLSCIVYAGDVFFSFFLQNLFRGARNMLKYGDVILLIRPQVWKFAITILHTAAKIKKKETIKIF